MILKQTFFLCLLGILTFTLLSHLLLLLRRCKLTWLHSNCKFLMQCSSHIFILNLLVVKKGGPFFRCFFFFFFPRVLWCAFLQLRRSRGTTKALYLLLCKKICHFCEIHVKPIHTLVPTGTCCGPKIGYSTLQLGHYVVYVTCIIFVLIVHSYQIVIWWMGIGHIQWFHLANRICCENHVVLAKSGHKLRPICWIGLSYV